MNRSPSVGTGAHTANYTVESFATERSSTGFRVMNDGDVVCYCDEKAAATAIAAALGMHADLMDALVELKRQVKDVILPNAKNVSLDFAEETMWCKCVHDTDALIARATGGAA
jgi:hypothetical protein